MGFREPLTRRVTTGGYVRGRWNENTPVDSTIFGSMHPAPGKVREQVPEGLDSTTAMVLITETRLNTVETAANGKADQVQWEGMWLRVFSEESGQNNVIPHYSYGVAAEDA